MTESSADTVSTDERGHYATGGGAILFVGCVGLLIAGYASITDAPTGFIDRPAMAVMSALFTVVGTWMVRAGQRSTRGLPQP